MVIKVYISGLSGNKEVKKHQQKAILIMDSHKVDYDVIDITEPDKEDDKLFMQENCKVRENVKVPLFPHFFNGEDYCGDFEDFDSAVEVNKVLVFLKLEEDTGDDDLLNTSTNGVSGDHKQQPDSVPEKNGKHLDQTEEDGDENGTQRGTEETNEA